MQTARAPHFLFLVALALGFAWPFASSWAAHPDPLRVAATKGAVASDTPDASRAGAAVLRAGGNAVDAAVATALALGVVAPGGSGLGGGGFAVIWNQKEGRARTIDFREIAAAAASRDMYVGKAAEASKRGGLAVAVPAEGAGLYALHKALGHLPLQKVVAPVVALARGFTPIPRLIDTSKRVGPKLPPGEPMLRWLYPNGHPLTAESRVVRANLADTIARFGKLGRDAIYRGPVAADLVSAIQAHGGIVTAEELSAYEPIWRDPLVGSFRGRTIYTIAPPGGGATAIEALNFLDALPALPKGSLGSASYLHRIAEALTNAFADRARWMGDPKFFPVPIDRLASPDYGKSLASHFSEDKVRPIEEYGTPAEKGSPVEPAHDHGTTHVCVVDGEGNAVALTTTVNLELGAQFEGPRSGIVLNDQMDDFSTFPGKPNAFGLVGGEANSIAAGKRPLSSMSPTLVVQDGALLMCAGGSGGPTIPASTVQAIVAVIDEAHDADGAVSTPRVYAQWKPDTIVLEQDTPTDVADGLIKRGHKIRRLEHGAPAAQVILIHDNLVEAASDPRKGGVPASP